MSVSTQKRTCGCWCYTLRIVSLLQVRKQELVRDAIWDAAMDLFAEKGFDETTVEDISAAAGISRRTFFRYFASKNDLLGQGIVDYAGALSEAIAGCPAQLRPAEVMRATVVRVAERFAGMPRTGQILRIAARYPAAREAQLSRMAELQERVGAAYLGRGLGTVEAGVMAGMTLSVLSVTFRSWFETGEREIGKTVSEVFATLDTMLRPGGRGGC